MAEGVSEIPKWLKFFENAGIQVSHATNYALIFAEHRIQENMIGELTKDYLTDMGISAMGDIIAILRQAQTHSASCNGVLAVKESPAVVRPVKASAAATRIVSHYLSGSATPPLNHNSRSAQNSRLLHTVSDSNSKHNQGANGSKKESVFSRLDLSGKKSINCKSTGSLQSAHMPRLKRSSGMMADRLDGSIMDDSDDGDDSEDSNGPPLEYQGVLKCTGYKPPPRKMPARESTQHHDKSPTTRDLRARTAVGGTRTAGILSLGASASTPSAKQRLGSIHSSSSEQSSSLR